MLKALAQTPAEGAGRLLEVSLCTTHGRAEYRASGNTSGEPVQLL